MKKKKTEMQRLKEWKEFLKDDADFDYEHILRVLVYKLGRTRKCIVSDNIIADAKQVAGEILEVETLITKVIRDNYFKEISVGFVKKYGELEWKPTNNKNGLTEMHFFFPRENPRTRSAIFRRWHDLERRAEQAKMSDLRNALVILSDKIWGWWD